MTTCASAYDLAAQVVAKVPGPARPALLRRLRDEVTSPNSYEASVRGDGQGRVRAGRLMVERATPAVVQALFDVIGVPTGVLTSQWLTAADNANVPLIAGWDYGRPTPCAKLYVNASDVSADTRHRLAAELMPSAVARRLEPAVLGLNACADGELELKVYVQASDAVALAEGLPNVAAALAQAAREEGADAGGVLCYDVTGDDIRPRAFFVATREGQGDKPWRFLTTLPGFDAETIAALFPFTPATPRSVGVALTGSDWTLYCKPSGSGRAPTALEPIAIYRSDAAEVGVFVEPNEHAARAFRRTARHAVSIRIRNGNPRPEAVEALVDWFTAQLAVAEERGSITPSPSAAPPAPWAVIDPMQRMSS